MKEFKEILFALLIGFGSFLSLARLNQYMKATPRPISPVTPTTLSGPSEDPHMELNWGLQAIGADRIAARAPDSLDDGVGPEITVAVIDTGCDIHHPDLAAHIWTNPGETGLDENGLSKASNGIDDDGNGFVDDVHGWDFVSNSPVVTDDHGHGTHIAGIITATASSPRVSLMILKYYDAQSDGVDNLIHTIQAINYAAKMGARVINYSGGGLMRNQAEEDALRRAGERGVLLVAAAGNEGMNSDFFPFYPADYDLGNIVSVGAVDRSGHLLGISNFGLSTVDVAAPGKNIYSSLPGGEHGFMSGTSQATAFVTGVIARMAGDDPGADPRHLIDRLLSNGRGLAALKGRIGRGQMLDASANLNPDSFKIGRLNKDRSPSTEAN
jgi:subtilisin family serine protease